MDYIQANLIDPVSKVLHLRPDLSLVAVGIYFTIRTRFIQIRYFGRMLRQVLHSRESGDGISSFQAFCIGLALPSGHRQHRRCGDRVDGGWSGRDLLMWVVAAIGMATALIEATLGQIFYPRRRRQLQRRAGLHIQRGWVYAPAACCSPCCCVFTFGFVQHAAGQRDQRRAERLA